MASLEELSPEHQAVLELLLPRDLSYEEVGELVGVSATEVKRLAHSALDSMTPASRQLVGDEQRALIADYLLGRGAADDRAYVRRQLRGPGGVQAWAASVLDTLQPLYPDARYDEMRDSLRGSAAPQKAAAPTPSPRGRPSARVAGAVFGAVALIVLAVLVLTGAFSGDDHGKSAGSAASAQTTPTTSTTSSTGSPTVESSGRFAATKGEQASGGAAIYKQGNSRALVVQSQLKPSDKKHAYEVWLYNGPSDARGLGAQATTKKGVLQGQAALPTNYRNYRAIALSREPTGVNPTKPTQLVAVAQLTASGK